MDIFTVILHPYPIFISDPGPDPLKQIISDPGGSELAPQLLTSGRVRDKGSKRRKIFKGKKDQGNIKKKGMERNTRRDKRGKVVAYLHTPVVWIRMQVSPDPKLFCTQNFGSGSGIIVKAGYGPEKNHFESTTLRYMRNILDKRNCHLIGWKMGLDNLAIVPSKLMSVAKTTLGE
jgi:hypothetical protein